MHKFSRFVDMFEIWSFLSIGHSSRVFGNVLAKSLSYIAKKVYLRYTDTGFLSL